MGFDPHLLRIRQFTTKKRRARKKEKARGPHLPSYLYFSCGRRGEAKKRRRGKEKGKKKICMWSSSSIIVRFGKTERGERLKGREERRRESPCPHWRTCLILSLPPLFHIRIKRGEEGDTEISKGRKEGRGGGRGLVVCFSSPPRPESG